MLEAVDDFIDGDDTLTRQLDLLRQIERYKRCQPPSKEELGAFAKCDDQQLLLTEQVTSPLAASRLPFHLLLGEKPWRIISAYSHLKMLAVKLIFDYFSILM